MLRFLAFVVVCFLIPFGAYGLWMHFVRPGLPDRAIWTYRAMMRLSAAGIVLALVAIVAVVSFSGGRAGTTYHPAVIKDGQVVPGGFD